jgi:hypothetical protein
MDSPTKKIKRATAKFIRDELAAAQSSHTLQYGLLQVIIAILLGLLLSFGVVYYW